MPTITYPFDSTGIALTNKIIGEQHVATEINYQDYYFIVPMFSPFYAGGLVVTRLYNGITTTLIEGVDYQCAIMYVGAVRSIALPIYGGITLSNLKASGIISIDYQTLGGIWSANRNYVIERLAETIYNPRTTIWDNLTDVQELFPPINHNHDSDTVYSQAELIESILAIATAITSKP